MSSGVKVDPECIEAFNQFKLGKKDAFLLFGFNQNATKIIVLHKEAKLPDDQKKTKNEQWDNLVSMLPDNDVRYAVADVHYNTSEGPRTDMVFVTWAPETATIKQRMLMASSKDALKNALVGCRTTIQACCYPDLDLKAVVDKFKGTLE
ncbi:actin depolymerizing factor [Brachionus plicatilis]|uniref:Actin depolymerizing factor n=1 Tax=Brachionus plicatilis TaxID=10195 RepID=A0A3M7QH77_BRAPC|nr:actin depolymerizing factor [Brachionus plicatilis]